MPPSGIAPLISTPAYHYHNNRAAHTASEQSSSTSSRGSVTGTSRTGASSPTSTPGTRGILEHQPKFFGASGARTASTDRASGPDRTKPRMLLDGDNPRIRLAGVGRHQDPRDPRHAFVHSRRREEPRRPPVIGRTSDPKNASPHTPSSLIARDAGTPASNNSPPRATSMLGSDRSGINAGKRPAETTPDGSRPIKRSRSIRRNTPPITIDSSDDESGPSRETAVSRTKAGGSKDENDDIQFISPDEAKILASAWKSKSPTKPPSFLGDPGRPPATTVRPAPTPSMSPTEPVLAAPPTTAATRPPPPSPPSTIGLGSRSACGGMIHRSVPQPPASLAAPSAASPSASKSALPVAQPASTSTLSNNSARQPSRSTMASPIMEPPAALPRQPSTPVSLQSSRLSRADAEYAVRRPLDADLQSFRTELSARLDGAVSSPSAAIPPWMSSALSSTRPSWKPSTTLGHSSLVHAASATKPSPTTTPQPPRSSPSTTTRQANLASAVRPPSASTAQRDRPTSYAGTKAEMSSMFSINIDPKLLTLRDQTSRGFGSATASFSSPATFKSLSELIRRPAANALQTDRQPWRPADSANRVSFPSTSSGAVPRRPPAPSASARSAPTPIASSQQRSADAARLLTTPVPSVTPTAARGHAPSSHSTTSAKGVSTARSPPPAVRARQPVSASRGDQSSGTLPSRELSSISAQTSVASPCLRPPAVAVKSTVQARAAEAPTLPVTISIDSLTGAKESPTPATIAAGPETPQEPTSASSFAVPESSAQRVQRIVLKVSGPPERTEAGNSPSQAVQSTSPPGSPSGPLHVIAKPSSRRPNISKNPSASPRNSDAGRPKTPILPRPLSVQGTFTRGSQSAPSSLVSTSAPTATAGLRRSTRSREASPSIAAGNSATSPLVQTRQDARTVTSLTLKPNRSSPLSVSSATTSSSGGSSEAARQLARSTSSSHTSSARLGDIHASSLPATSDRLAALNSAVPSPQCELKIGAVLPTKDRRALAQNSTQNGTSNGAAESPAAQAHARVTSAAEASRAIAPPATPSAPLTPTPTAAKTSVQPGVDRVVKDAHRPAISSPLAQSVSTAIVAAPPGSGPPATYRPNFGPSTRDWLFASGVRLPRVTGYVPDVADIFDVLRKIAMKSIENAHWVDKPVRRVQGSPVRDDKGGSRTVLLAPDMYLEKLRAKPNPRLPPLFQPRSRKRPMPFLYRNIRQGLHGIAAYQNKAGAGIQRENEVRDKVITYRRAEAGRRSVLPVPLLDGMLERRETEESLASQCRIHRRLSVILRSVRLIYGDEDIPFKDRTVFPIHSTSNPWHGPAVEAVRSATLTIRVDGRLVWRDARLLAVGQRKFCKFVGHAANEPIEIMLPPNSRSLTYELGDMRDRFGDCWPPLEGGARTWIGRVALGAPHGGREMLWGEGPPERIDLRASPRENSRSPLLAYGIRLSARYGPLVLEPSLRMNAIRPRIVAAKASRAEVTYLTVTTLDEVAQARAKGPGGATEASSILTHSTTVRGWRCVACRRLGDLGGEEELAIHLRVSHADECTVECLGRKLTGDGIKLALLIKLGDAMAKPKETVVDSIAVQSPGNIERLSIIAALAPAPETPSEDSGPKAMALMIDDGHEDAEAEANSAKNTVTRGDQAVGPDVSVSSVDDEDRILDEDTSDASGEVPLVADHSADALGASADRGTVSGRRAQTKDCRDATGADEGDDPVTVVPEGDALKSVNGNDAGDKSARMNDRASAQAALTEPADPPASALSMTPLTAGRVQASDDEAGSTREQPNSKDIGAKDPVVILTPPSMVRDLSSELSSIAQSVVKRRPGRLRPWEEKSTVSPGEEVPHYDNPLGLMQPQMKGRQNQFTTWSSRINPGTAFDLIPDLDKLWDGGEYRYLLRHIEECNISLWHHLSEKRRFMCMCWGRWRDEKGPLTAKDGAMVPYLRKWLDKYAPIMRRAELHEEVIDLFYFLFAEDLITGRAMRKAVDHWLKLAKQERKRLGRETEQDLWEEETSKRDGVLAWDEQPDSEPEGLLPDGDQWAMDVIEKYARKFKATARRLKKAGRETMRDEGSDDDGEARRRSTRAPGRKRTRTRETSEDALGIEEDEDEVDREDDGAGEGRPRTRRRLGLRERRESRKMGEKQVEVEDDIDAATVTKEAVSAVLTMTTTKTTTITTTTERNGLEQHVA